MQFTSEKPIYQQIIELVEEKILQQQWTAEQKIPSVREMGAALEVNPNTVMRAYDKLQHDEIIYNKRGLGFFVSTEAKNLVQQEKKKQFIQKEIPELLRTAKLLGISLEEISALYNKQ